MRDGSHWYAALNSAFWAAGLPGATLLALEVSPLAVVMLGAYPARIARLHLRGRRSGRPHRLAFAHALLNTIDKHSELVGAARYAWDRFRGQRSRIIEHKRSRDAAPRDSGWSDDGSGIDRVSPPT